MRYGEHYCNKINGVIQPDIK